MVHRIYTAELQLNKTNASDTEAASLDLNLFIHNYTVSTKYMINMMILIFILLIFRSLIEKSLGAYISQHIRFARVTSHVNDFNNRNTF